MPQASGSGAATTRERTVQPAYSLAVDDGPVNLPNRWSRQPASLVLHALDWLASRSWVALTVVALDSIWVLFSARFEFPTRLEVVFQSVVAAVTLAMVFVIQHTQARQQAVTQRKLDEILRALPEADKSLITLEKAPDRELRHATKKHRHARHEVQG
jgi:low affinity Fe/Cu permease